MDPMKCLTILLLLPVFLYAQPFDNWLTPFATVEFEEEQIVFRVPMMDVSCGFEPIFLLNDKFLVQYEPMHNISCADIQEGVSTLGSYLENPLYPDGSNSDRIRYIKAFALQTFLALRGDGLPSAPVYDKVRQMADGPNREIVQMANMATRLYRCIETSLIEQSGLVNYLSFTGLSGQDLDLFSAERLMQTNHSKSDIPEEDSIVWPKYYGAPDRNDYSRDFIEFYDKGYLIAGGFNEFAWLIKTNINGDTLWSSIIGCDGLIFFNAIYQTVDGGFLSCGAVKYNNSSVSMPLVVKFNSCGEKDWCKAFQPVESFVLPYAEDIIETVDGEIIVIMNQLGVYPQESLHILKLNSEGDILWKKPICSGFMHPESSIATGQSLVETANGKYLIAGSVYWEHPWNPGGVKALRPFFAMVNSEGMEEWVLPFGLQDTITGKAMNAIEQVDNTFIGVGSYWPTAIDRSLNIMKFDNLGNELSINILEASVIDSTYVKGYLLDFIRIDSLFFFGGIIGPFLQGGNNVVEFSTDTNLFASNLKVKSVLNHPNTEEPYTLKSTYDKKIISDATIKVSNFRDIYFSKSNQYLIYDTTYPGTYTYDSLCTTPGLPQSGFIFLDDCDIITGMDIPSPDEYYASVQTILVTAYPNPAETEITLAFQNTEHHNNMLLECYNLFGQRVHSEKIYKGQQKTKLSVEQWQSGLYIAVVKSEGNVAGQVRFVKK
jgi:hypothetical protein